MFLYDKPALLTKEDHGDLGLSQPERPFDFVRGIKAAPIVSNEIQTAQKHYPIIFSGLEDPVMLAVLGVIESDNLFVDDAGKWEIGSYVPSYIRCHPLALAMRGEGEYAVIIDEASNAISENPEIPFFVGDDMNPDIQARLDLCGQFRMESERTLKFCQRVKELGLLNGQRVQQTQADGTEEKVADYVTIDANKLKELDKDVLQELHQDGSLAAIYGQLFSLENWNRLIARRNRRRDND
ncbi:MAG: SapC family protein [Woeseiaceae bacterium]